MEFAYKLASEKIYNDENNKPNDVTLDSIENLPGQNTRKSSSGARILRQLDQVSRRQKHMINLLKFKGFAECFLVSYFNYISVRTVTHNSTKTFIRTLCHHVGKKMTPFFGQHFR